MATSSRSRSAAHSTPSSKSSPPTAAKDTYSSVKVNHPLVTSITDPYAMPSGYSPYCLEDEFSEGRASSKASFASRVWTNSSSRFILCSVTNGDGARELLAEKVRELICEEWEEGVGGSLESALVYQRLLEEGVEVPDYQMSAILNALRVGGLITVWLRPQREEEVRKHGDLLITGLSPELCDS
jgi:hypothetical protein